MAALMRHAVVVTATTSKILSPKYTVILNYATKAEKRKKCNIDKKLPPKITSTADSIAAKGFLRPQREYNPPDNVDEKLQAIFHRNNIKNDKITDLNDRFKLFLACEKEFNHPIPNSVLHKIETIEDVKIFYKTPVCTTTPLDKMRNMDLPENLHVQFEYHRFHPETDTIFQGQTAFNRSSTIVTGLKYKDKYKGHAQNTEWPFNS